MLVRILCRYGSAACSRGSVVLIEKVAVILFVDGISPHIHCLTTDKHCRLSYLLLVVFSFILLFI